MRRSAKVPLTILAVAGLAWMSWPGQAAERPNVVLFLVDDMGWMDCSPYGSRYYETPHMDKLAKQAMRFTDAYAVPLCSPTRASILTGQYSSRHGVTSATGHRPPAEPGAPRYPARAAPNRKLLYANSRNYLDPQLVTLAEVLRESGYRTGHFGKWHLGLSTEHRPEQQGFETAWHCAPDPGPPSYFSPYGVHTSGKPTHHHRVGTITDGPDGEYITDRLTDEAIKFIERHKDEPFYLNLWQYGVHGPWGHKEEYTAEFAKKTDPRGLQRNPIMASMLKSVDESLGRVVAKLDELDLTRNTLFIFYSDNGGNTHSNMPNDRRMTNTKPGSPRYAMVEDWRRWAGPEPPTNNTPLREGKGRIYEGGQRVPLMVRWPGKVAPGMTCDAVVGAIDLFPTILDSLEIDRPKGQAIDGVSLLPVLKQTGRVDREAYFTWFPHLVPAVSVRQGPWKLIRRFEPHPDYPEVFELYNLEEDIGEALNLAARMPEKVKALDALIDGFVEETGALMPRPNPAHRPGDPAGLVARNCRVTPVDGALRVEGDGSDPFLGTAQVRTAAPLTLKLRLRAPAGGTGKVRWKTANQERFPNEEQVVEFSLAKRDDWQEIDVNLPFDAQPQIVRLHLPAGEAPVDLQSIDFVGPKGSVKTWDFTSLKAK